MPARLVIIDAGPAEQPDRWIEKPFLTIGCAAGNDVPLGGEGDAQVYVQFRDGRYEVFNKQAADIRLGGQAVPRGRSAAWEPAAELVIAGRRLRLDVDGDPTPAPRLDVAVPRPARRAAPAAESRPQPAADRAADPADRPRAKPAGGQGVKVLVIGVCAAASALMLLKDRLPVGKAEIPVLAPEEFTTLVTRAFDEKTGAGTAAVLHRRLARRLQWAEAAWLAEDWSTAGARYAALKRYIETTQFTADAAENDWRSRLAAMVDQRLDALATQSTKRGAQRQRRSP